MELIEMYHNALYNLYTSHVLVKDMDKQIRQIIKKDVEEKYLGKLTEFQENSYECMGVNVELYGTFDSGNFSKFSSAPANITLSFFLTKPKNKAHKEKIEQAIIYFKDKGWLPYNGTKTELWLDMRYTVSVEKLLNKKYSLQID